MENECDNSEAASTTFGLPMRTDDWGQTDVSDNRCTTYGRAYNTDPYGWVPMLGIGCDTYDLLRSMHEGDTGDILASAVGFIPGGEIAKAP